MIKFENLKSKLQNMLHIHIFRFNPFQKTLMFCLMTKKWRHYRPRETGTKKKMKF